MRIERILCALTIIALQACGGGGRTAGPTLVPETRAISYDSSLAPVDGASAAKYLFVTEHIGQELLAYQAPFTGPPFLTARHPTSTPAGVLAVNSSGVVFHGVDGDGVYEYAPPYTNPPTVLFAHHAITSLGIDAAQNLFVSLNGHVAVCPPPYTTFTNFGEKYNITNITVAANGALFTLTAGTGTPFVQVFEKPYGAPTVTITLPLSFPNQVFTDSNSNLFVPQVTRKQGEILEYPPPYSGPPKTVATFSSSDVAAMAFDKRGDIFLIDQTSEQVLEYKPPYTQVTGLATLLFPRGLALDEDGNLYVSDLRLNQIFVYSPPYTGHVKQVIYRHLSEPYQMIAF